MYIFYPYFSIICSFFGLVNC